ncbi:MAG TPA: hypothetical protein VE779_08095 [Candidatus Angelobacter sp.]|nr:hypothetical protein [Candidatus Angelobacter sp.]
MGVRFPTTYTSVWLTTLPASSVETLVATTPVMTTANDTGTVLVGWHINLLIGAGCTSVIFDFRRGAALTGTSLYPVSPANVVAAGNYYLFAGCYFDVAPGGTAQYSMGILQGGAPSVASIILEIGLYAFQL